MGTIFMPFRAEVWTKTITYDDAGQSIEDWTLNRTIKCQYMPNRAEERLVGRTQNPRSFVLWTNDNDVVHNNQIRNLKDRYGNSIEDGEFNITGIKKFAGWSKVHHSEIVIQKVLK